MIRFFRAIAWLRWRILINSIKGGRRRDSLEELSRIGAVLAPIIYALMFVPTAIAIAAGAFIGGMSMARSEESITLVTAIVRVLLALSTLAVLMAPLVRSIQGAQVDLARLLLLPIPRRVLHLSEMVGGLSDPWLAVMVPGVLLLPAGLVAGGAWTAGALAMLAGLAVLGALAALSSLCSFTAMLLFRDRRRAELITLVLVLTLSLLAFLPAVFEEELEALEDSLEGDVELPAASDTEPFPGPDTERSVEPRAEPAAADAEPSAASHPEQLAGHDTKAPASPDFERMIRWAGGFPSELYGKSVKLAATRRPGSALLRLAGLLTVGGLLFALSGWTHRKLLESPESGSSRRSGEPARARSFRIPGLGVSSSAVALAQARTALRTVRGKMAVYFTFAFVALMYLLFGDSLRQALLEHIDAPPGPLLLFVGAGFTLLALQPILLNQFAVDGAGLTMQFLRPITDREMVRGKILGCGLLACISSALCLLVALVLAPGGHPLYWLSMVLVAASAYLLLAPVCSLVSALLPKTADLSRMGKAGNPHPLAAFLGMLLTVLSLAPPLGLFAAGLLLARSPLLTFVLVIVWSTLVALVSIPLTRLAATAVDRRRENLLLVATGR